ncbi:MAG TPA: type III pantothenate kinase [Prolixibacteraceae bacterium]|nr:type III pantothenate kinase [Prolixibacteraceae bacterium]
MLNLIIDIGNTLTKIAIFEKGEIIVSFTTDSLTEHDVAALKTDHPTINSAIISSVRQSSTPIINSLKNEFEFVIELDHNTPLPIINCYKTPETLGKDRIAAAVGANFLYPQQNLLIIDAGTAITYDFVDSKNQYIGGFITPGLNMRFKALHYFTEKLPLLHTSLPDHLIGDNTSNSIIGGVQYGLEGETERIIKYHSDLATDLLIILAGGDKNYFEKLLKNYKFVALEIILLGLNTILEFNKIQNNG